MLLKLVKLAGLITSPQEHHDQPRPLIPGTLVIHGLENVLEGKGKDLVSHHATHLY